MLEQEPIVSLNHAAIANLHLQISCKTEYSVDAQVSGSALANPVSMQRGRMCTHGTPSHGSSQLPLWSKVHQSYRSVGERVRSSDVLTASNRTLLGPSMKACYTIYLTRGFE
jgi:hypothetical protein